MPLPLAWGVQRRAVHPPGGTSRYPLAAGTAGSSPSIPVRCYANNTITKTQNRDKQKTSSSREGGREDQSQSDILLLDYFREE